MKPSKEQWAYLAGLFDGEGCVNLTIRVRERSNGRVEKAPIRSLSITQKYGNMLRQLRDEFGVGGISCKSDGRTRWLVSKGQDIEYLLLGMLPYLRLKQDQAHLLIYFIQNSKTLTREEKFGIVKTVIELKHQESVAYENSI